MRRTTVVLSALAAVLLGTVPASAASAGPAESRTSAPAPAWEVPAGERCDFAVHSEDVVDEVVEKVLTTHPDGSPKKVLYTGALVVRVVNSETGASYDADAGGTALVEYRLDGSQFWWVDGPVLIGFAENGGNMPRGLYIVDGVYTLHISATGYRTVTMAHGSHDDLCARVA